MSIEKPKGAQFYYRGVHYKVGMHDKIFRWIDEAWIVANWNFEALRRAVKKDGKDGGAVQYH